MPRNEFADHPEDEEAPELVGNQDDIRWAINKIHPGKGEDEVLNQEVLPVTDEDPHLWPTLFWEPSLAELRRGPGLTTTEAHIAAINRESKEDDTLFD